MQRKKRCRHKKSQDMFSWVPCNKMWRLVVEIDAVKVCIKNIGLEGGEISRPPVTVQVVDAMTEKRNQDQEKCQQIAEMYDALT
jgi:hypothetical protein